MMDSFHFTDNKIIVFNVPNSSNEHFFFNMNCFIFGTDQIHLDITHHVVRAPTEIKYVYGKHRRTHMHM